MNEWIMHTGDSAPEDLAPAQLVEVAWPFVATPGNYLHRVESLNWETDVFYYRPALTEDGLPYVSAKGLDSKAEYVAVNGEGEVYQHFGEPVTFDEWSEEWFTIFQFDTAPATHAIPGDPENSLAKVWKQQ